MSRRRLRRKERSQRHAPVPSRAVTGSPPAIREATRVERLAYTRTQAAEALGISRSTFNRRVLAHIETIEMPWGARLVPVDELDRLIAERRRPPSDGSRASQPLGRPAALTPDVVKRIRTDRAAGKSLAQIARDLNADGTPTAHSGERWWPSTVRSVVLRSAPE